MEHFAGALSLLNPQTFREVFSQTIDFVVERIYKNYALQIMANSFLANNVPSPIFATILVEYLLDRMHEMVCMITKIVIDITFNSKGRIF